MATGTTRTADTSIEQQQLNNFLGPVKGALGGLPVAEKNQDYFIVFQQAGGTGPEIIDQTACFITYLVDSKGNISKPVEDNVSLYNLIQNFEVGKNAILRNDASTTDNSPISGKQQITAIGRQQPILYTQTGSSINAHVDEIFFIDGVDSELPEEGVLDFRGVMVSTASGSIPTSFANITDYTQINNSPDAGAASFSITPGTYTVVSDGTSSLQNIEFSISANVTNNGPTAKNAYIRLLRDGSVVQTGQSLVPAGNNAPISVYWAEDVSDMGGDPVYRLQVKADNTSMELDSAYFNISTQNPNPGSQSSPGSQTPFWEQGPNIDNYYLTASGYLSANYGNNPLPIQKCLDFNFSPIRLPFLIQKGDRIRFGYNPNNDYYIYDIITPEEDVDGRLKIKLNQYLSPVIDFDNFVLHRVNENDPAYIILNVAKSDLVGNTQNFNGVILPEYPTQELQNNLDNIIIDLKERGIITDNEN
jgi:hypothetical protein